jgi:hypothetical protein
VILINAVVLGLETYPGLTGSYHDLFDTLDHVILGIYVVELLIRLTAFGWKPHEFAKDKAGFRRSRMRGVMAGGSRRDTIQSVRR